MLLLDWTGTGEEIRERCEAMVPYLPRVLELSAKQVPFLKRQIWDWQAAPLYLLAKQFNERGARILEIGTAWGYSASILAQAAPQARIVTLNPKPNEAPLAKNHLAHWPNVTVMQKTSEEYWQTDPGPFDMVFVDGDHRRPAIEHDCQWFNRLKSEGLIFFHDYAPEPSTRPCPPVYDVVNEFAAKLGRPLDVVVMSHENVGMAGMYRRYGERV